MTEKWEQIRIDAWRRYIAEEERNIRERNSDLARYQDLIETAKWSINNSEKNIEQYKKDLKEQEILK